MKLRLALAAATCLALPAMASAQPVTGPYVNLGAGTSYMFPVDNSYFAHLKHQTVFDLFNYRNHFQPDYAGAAGIGYGLGNGFRVELDVDYIRNTADTYDAYYGHYGLGGKLIGHGLETGAEEKYGPTLNVLYDIPLNLPVTPYVGAGVGYQWVMFNRDIAQHGKWAGLGPSGGTQGSFAYDVIAGASLPVAAVPGLSLTAEYRFMQLTATHDYHLRHVAEDYFYARFGQESSNTFTLGLRYALFAPPLAAPAVASAPEASPAPAAARTYLVFFDWNKADLTSRATQIIAQAASDSKTQATTSLDVSGYTDTSGTPAYNQGLSLRRAKTVAARLIADGVPASEIEIQAFGETHLLVPTGPGVREPQNRRVEIVLN
jgi:outer membrane protein OmpA-like peptidoglycan-associated protein